MVGATGHSTEVLSGTDVITTLRPFPSTVSPAVRAALCFTARSKMALPVIRNALECANYTTTVQPYTYQLRPLPQIFFESATNAAALKQIYLDTNPLISAFAFSLALGPIFLIASEINRNYSQVDRFWSILPTVYNAHYAIWSHMAGYQFGRLDLLLVASTIWSIRLTYNYWRRGGYSIGSEDYRWNIVKNYAGQPWFFLFNVTFISFVQSILLFTITTPAYVLLLKTKLAVARSEPLLEIGDMVASGVMVCFVALTFAADQQQWNYQTTKYEYRDTGKIPPGCGFTQEELDRGFCTSGLYSVSRHPNYAAEQAIWVTLHVWSCYITDAPFNWTGVGAIGYLGLFQASTWLTELLTSQKYPQYKIYQEQVGMFFPMTKVTGPPVFPKGSSKQIADAAAKTKDAAKARERYNLR